MAKQLTCDIKNEAPLYASAANERTKAEGSGSVRPGDLKVSIKRGVVTVVTQCNKVC
jgi:hypothetical protein